MGNVIDDEEEDWGVTPTMSTKKPRNNSPRSEEEPVLPNEGVAVGDEVK